MQCPQCKFENMPGLDNCFRCGAILTASAATVNVHPPRAPRWRKPFRRLSRGVRMAISHRPISTSRPKSPSDPDSLLARLRAPISDTYVFLRRSFGSPGRFLAAITLSIVPGLAQIFQRRFKAVWIYVLSWVVCLGIGLYLIGSFWGQQFFMSAVIVHGWIFMDAVLLEAPRSEKTTIFARLLGRLAILICFCFAIHSMYANVNRHLLGFTGGPSGIAVPYHQLQMQDIVLCRYARGDTVFHHGDIVMRDFNRWFGRGIGQIVGMPGDYVELKRDHFEVNYVPLSSNRFSVPACMRGRTFSRAMNANEYFVTMEYNLQNANEQQAREILLRECVLNRAGLVARGVALWLPASRRGRFEVLE